MAAAHQQSLPGLDPARLTAWFPTSVPGSGDLTATHAIRAGEGEVFVSAGVEVVSRHTKGSSDSLPDTLNPAFDEARARTETAADGGDGWHDPDPRGHRAGRAGKRRSRRGGSY